MAIPDYTSPERSVTAPIWNVGCARTGKSTRLEIQLKSSRVNSWSCKVSLLQNMCLPEKLHEAPFLTRYDEKSRFDYCSKLKEQWDLVVGKYPRWFFINNACENINHYAVTTPETVPSKTLGILFRRSFLDKRMRDFLLKSGLVVAGG